MSEVLASAEDQQITECEEYALCHGEATRKKSYTSQKVKKSMASMGTDWYQKAFASGEARLVMADETNDKTSSCGNWIKTVSESCVRQSWQQQKISKQSRDLMEGSKLSSRT